MIFGRTAPDPDLDELGPQRVRVRPSGAEVFNVDRERLGYTLDGRTWTPFVERGPGAYAVYVDRDATWDDGTAMSGADLQTAGEIVTRVLRHWKVPAVEIVWPEPRPAD